MAGVIITSSENLTALVSYFTVELVSEGYVVGRSAEKIIPTTKLAKE